MKAKTILKSRVPWHYRDLLGQSFPPPEDTVKGMLSAVSDRLLKQGSIIAKRNQQDASLIDIEAAAGFLASMQLSVNQRGLPSGRFLSDEDGEWIEDLPKIDQALGLVDSSGIPRDLCFYCLLALSVIDQDLSDQWRFLKRHVDDNLEKYGLPSQDLARIERWLKRMFFTVKYIEDRDQKKISDACETLLTRINERRGEIRIRLETHVMSCE